MSARAWRLSCVQATSPESAGSHSTGSVIAAARSCGRCSHMPRSTRMCRSRVSHGAIVPSARTSKLASAPSSPSSGQSGCEARMTASIRVSAMPTSGGGASAVAQSSHEGKRPPRSMKPPSTQATPAVSPGWAAASSTTTLPPHDWPTATGRSQPVARTTAARSSATVVMSYPSSGLAERPWPRWSTATTGWPAAARWRATPSHNRALDASPCTSTTPRPVGEGGDQS